MAEMKENISGLSCPVCYNSYKTSEETFVPRSLSCGHTYCTGCLEKLISERNDALIIRCPTCKRETVLLTPDCSSNLPKNFGLLEIVSMYENSEELSTPKTDSTRNTDDKPICNEHDEPMKVYCHTDKCLICIYCQVYGDHAGHDCQLVCQLVKDKKEFIKNIYRQSLQNLKRFVQAKVSNDKAYTSMKQNENVLKGEIGWHFQELRSELDKREEYLRKRMQSKIREQTMALLTQERTCSKLIRKGNELRTRCCNLLKSPDYTILVTEEKSICDVKEELRALINNCSELAPSPSRNLGWVFEEELMNTIKAYGDIADVDEYDSRSSQGQMRDDDLLNKADDELCDETLEALGGMVDSLSSTQAVIDQPPVLVDFGPCAGADSDDENEESDEQEDGEQDEHEEEIEGAVGGGSFNVAAEQNQLINELRSEMRREIQRLKMISLPAQGESQALSDSSSENDETQRIEASDISHNTGIGDQSTMASGWAARNFDSFCVAHNQENPPDEGEEEYEPNDEPRSHRHHHHHVEYKPLQRAESAQHNGQSHPCNSDGNKQSDINVRNVCGMCKVSGNRWHQTQSLNNRHDHHALPKNHLTLRSHRQSGKHVRWWDLEGTGNTANSKHTRKCRGCHAIRGNKSQEVYSKSRCSTAVVGEGAVICPMCTLANEAGKTKCELCGFNLRI